MHGILTILHLGLLRMFIPSIDMIGIMHTYTLLQFCWFINSVFVLSSFFSLQLYLFCSFFSVPLGTILSLSSSASFHCIFFFADIYPLLSCLSFFSIFLSSLFFSKSSKIFCSSPICYLLIYFSCSSYKLLLSFPILSLSHRSDWISCPLCYIPRYVL